MHTYTETLYNNIGIENYSMFQYLTSCPVYNPKMRNVQCWYQNGKKGHSVFLVLVIFAKLYHSENTGDYILSLYSVKANLVSPLLSNDW